MSVADILRQHDAIVASGSSMRGAELTCWRPKYLCRPITVRQAKRLLDAWSDNCKYPYAPCICGAAHGM